MTNDEMWSNHWMVKLRSDLKVLNEKIRDLQEKISVLPPVVPSNRSVQMGHHSQLFFSNDKEHWIEIDLGKEQTIDLVAMFPAYVHGELGMGRHYGLPPHFKVELYSEGHQDIELISEVRT